MHSETLEKFSNVNLKGENKILGSWMLKHYKKKIENQLIKKIKAIRRNKCGEYEAIPGEFYSQNDIIYQITTLYSSQQNDIVECKN